MLSTCLRKYVELYRLGLDPKPVRLDRCVQLLVNHTTTRYHRLATWHTSHRNQLQPTRSQNRFGQVGDEGLEPPTSTV